MNQIITADWHCHTWLDCAQIINGVNSRLQDLLQALQVMVTYALKHRVQQIRVLGDIFHVKKNVPTEAQDQLFLFLQEAHRQGINWEFLAGNHDRISDREDSVTILPFRAFAPVRTEIIIDKSTKTVFVPWLYDQAKVLKTLQDLKGDWYELLFHGELEGATVGPTDYALSSRFKKELFDRFHHVWAGHLHKRQKVGKVYYPGNPIAKDWGEPERDKGFLHITDTGINIIPLPYPAFVSWEGEQLKEHHLVSLEPKSRGNFLRLKLEQKPDPALLKLLQDTARVVDVKLVKRAAIPAMQTKPLESGQNMTGLLGRYMAERNISPPLRPKYLAFMQEIMERE